MSPRVSVVIPCHNYAAFVGEAIESVLAQSFDDLEVIVVDDGSTDDSAEVVEAVIQRHPGRDVTLVRREPSGQPAYPRNDGIARARGEYILCLDADDAIAPEFLDRCVGVLDSDPGVSIAYGDQQNIGMLTTFEPHPAYDFAMLRRFNFVPPASVFRREAWEHAGGFATNVPGYEDWDFWLACGEAGHFGRHVPGVVWRYRHHGASLYGDARRRDNELKAQVVLNHPRLYDSRQAEWARGVLARDAGALALETPLGVVTEFANAPRQEQGPAGGPLEILFTMTGWEDEGGGTILPRQIAKALVRRGHRVTVLTAPVEERPGLPPYHVESAVDDGVRLLRLFNRPSRFNDPLNPERELDDPHARAVAKSIADEVRPDVVHLHSLLGFSLGVRDALGAPTVFTSHNYWPICPRMYLFRDDLSICDGPSPDGSKCGSCLGRPEKAPAYAARLEAGKLGLGRHLAVSRRVAELYAAAGHDPDRIHVLLQQPESADWIWARTGSRRQVVECLERPLRIGFIGSLYPHKGAHVLVQAVQAVDGVEAHVFGAGAPAYVDRLRSLDREGRVVFHGGYEPGALPELLAQVDVVCVPSVWEDCAPLVVAEALAARAPVVASSTGGIPDFVRDGESGVLFRRGDAAALAGILGRFAADPGLLGRLQAAIGPPPGFDSYLDALESHYRAEIAASSRVEGARAFAILAHADDLDEAALRSYAEAFGPADDATLVIHVPDGDTGPLERLVAAAGLDGDDGPDLLAVVGPAELHARVDAVLADVSARELRHRAEARWAQAA
jgi:glycosyltransferase involved in cell wall biosynthesis